MKSIKEDEFIETTGSYEEERELDQSFAEQDFSNDSTGPNVHKTDESIILIKSTQNHYLDTIFLQNRTTDFYETLHVAWVWLPEGYGNSGRSGYSPVLKKGGRRPP